MNNFIFLPIVFLKFWYFDAPLEMLKFFASLNSYMMQLFALPLCVRTFFKPLKNEYREGLVGFSRALGILVKSCFIVVDILLFFVMFFIELVIIILFLLYPITTLMLIFI